MISQIVVHVIALNVHLAKQEQFHKAIIVLNAFLNVFHAQMRVLALHALMEEYGVLKVIAVFAKTLMNILIKPLIYAKNANL